MDEAAQRGFLARYFDLGPMPHDGANLLTIRRFAAAAALLHSPP